MRFWLLTPLDEDSVPWGASWYNKVFGLVVAAENETAARQIASQGCGSEGGAAWLDASLSSCAELTADEKAGEILVDYRRA